MFLRIYIILCSFLVIFSLVRCGNIKEQSNENKITKTSPFVISNSSYQQWVAGTPQGGSGVNVFINFSNIQQGVVLKEIYFRNNKTKIITSPAVRVQYVGYFKNEPKRDIIMDSDPIHEAVNTPPKKTPFQLKEDEAVISYEFNGETAYYLIENLEEKKLLAYPASNPNGDN